MLLDRGDQRDAYQLHIGDSIYAPSIAFGRNSDKLFRVIKCERKTIPGDVVYELSLLLGMLVFHLRVPAGHTFRGVFPKNDNTSNRKQLQTPTTDSF